MTSRELRNQRREAERKARKLEYRQNLRGAGSLAGEPVVQPASETSVALPPNPELFDEFTAQEQSAMMALRARIHARAGLSSSPKPIAPPEPPDEPAVLACEARLPQHVSKTKAQESSGPTGPRSTEGKAISSANSLKHGLASGRVIVPGEDPADFEALLADLLAEHAPAADTEKLLVQEMAQSYWLMQRAIRLQNQAFTETRIDVPKLTLFMRYRTTHERAFYKALNALTKLKRNRAREEQAEFVSQSRRSSPPAVEFVSRNGAGPAKTSAKTGTAFEVPRHTPSKHNQPRGGNSEEQYPPQVKFQKPVAAG